MNRKPPPPYCLSRQHPELARRNPAQRDPIGAPRDAPSPAAPAGPKNSSGKGL